jgi:hypothetical protein
VVNLGEEAHFGRGHRIVVWQEQLELEHTALIRGLLWPKDHDIEVAEVFLGGRCANAGRCEGKEARARAQEKPSARP